MHTPSLLLLPSSSSSSHYMTSYWFFIHVNFFSRSLHLCTTCIFIYIYYMLIWSSSSLDCVGKISHWDFSYEYLPTKKIRIIIFEKKTVYIYICIWIIHHLNVNFKNRIFKWIKLNSTSFISIEESNTWQDGRLFLFKYSNEVMY